MYSYTRIRLSDFHNNTDCLRFEYALRSTLLRNSIRPSSGKRTLTSPLGDSFFAIKWTYCEKKSFDNRFRLSRHKEMRGNRNGRYLPRQY